MFPDTQDAHHGLRPGNTHCQTPSRPDGQLWDGWRDDTPRLHNAARTTSAPTQRLFHSKTPSVSCNVPAKIKIKFHYRETLLTKSGNPRGTTQRGATASARWWEARQRRHRPRLYTYIIYSIGGHAKRYPAHIPDRRRSDCECAGRSGAHVGHPVRRHAGIQGNAPRGKSDDDRHKLPPPAGKSSLSRRVK